MYKAPNANPVVASLVKYLPADINVNIINRRINPNLCRLIWWNVCASPLAYKKGEKNSTTYAYVTIAAVMIKYAGIVTKS